MLDIEIPSCDANDSRSMSVTWVESARGTVTVILLLTTNIVGSVEVADADEVVEVVVEVLEEVLCMAA